MRNLRDGKTGLGILLAEEAVRAIQNPYWAVVNLVVAFFTLQAAFPDRPWVLIWATGMLAAGRRLLQEWRVISTQSWKPKGGWRWVAVGWALLFLLLLMVATLLNFFFLARGILGILPLNPNQLDQAAVPVAVLLIVASAHLNARLEKTPGRDKEK